MREEGWSVAGSEVLAGNSYRSAGSDQEGRPLMQLVPGNQSSAGTGPGGRQSCVRKAQWATGFPPASAMWTVCDIGQGTFFTNSFKVLHFHPSVSKFPHLSKDTSFWLEMQSS